MAGKIENFRDARDRVQAAGVRLVMPLACLQGKDGGTVKIR